MGLTEVLNCSFGAFPGRQFRDQNGDIASMPIMGSNGAVVGMQFAVNNTTPSIPNQKFWQRITDPTGTYWALTTYFVDPNTACSSDSPFPEDMEADRLWLKIGESSDYMILPLEESETESNYWVTGRCFPSMGKHYWYKISKDMDCDYFFPLFLIYNNGNLNCYGPNIGVGESQTSSRWEHPTPSVLGYFFQAETTPSCLSNAVTPLSTQHVYLTNPIWDWC